MNEEKYTRPVRGAVRLDSLTWDVQPICDAIAALSTTDWNHRAHGKHWSDIPLFARGKDGVNTSHPFLSKSQALMSVLTGFPADAVDMCLASLKPGGSVKEHRDISGGTAANIIRLHIPIVTHPDVSFSVSGKRVNMAAGEVWHLDTTYRHSVANNSSITRIHLIIDLESSPQLLAMLPKSDYRDSLHTLAFSWICFVKGLSLIVKDPKLFVQKGKDFVALRFRGESVLYKSDEFK